MSKACEGLLNSPFALLERPRNTNMTYIDPSCRAFFVPALYMPSSATSLGLPGGIILALFSAASIFGQIMAGTFSDHFDLSWLIGITSICSATSIFGLWGPSKGFPMLASFAIICACESDPPLEGLYDVILPFSPSWNA